MHLPGTQHTVSHPAGPYSSNRLFEWAMAVMMLLIALTLALPGDTLERASLKPIADLGFGEGSMAFFFGAVGVLRITALYLNGHINNGLVRPNGANVRAICAGFGALIMGQLTLALVVEAITAAAPSFVIPVFGTLTLFEALSCYVARLDAVDRKSRLGQALIALEQVG
ncbi:hypothetical protein [Methylobacterium nodulans]|uniref:Transmembrane protein n=1 Tax=Methylobacterium nodulans (strain LMG 21967 / CNCM I-2342 / ORS 2060) TaxID=460265 RepID=B8ISF0_METNO|nr:hypothetical protein [Methylobacterium nodulans]ACL58790.1 conserved hypothetical protein [Methylobacterium nodulans ORS 2060]